MSGTELRERQEFVYEAALRMRDRFLHQEVWERLGVSARAMIPYFIRQNNEEEILFQRMLFAKIVPNCKKLGLLDGRDHWLRDRFTEIGVIEFEDYVDTSIEYSELNAFEANAVHEARRRARGHHRRIAGDRRRVGARVRGPRGAGRARGAVARTPREARGRIRWRRVSRRSRRPDARSRRWCNASRPTARSTCSSTTRASISPAR